MDIKICRKYQETQQNAVHTLNLRILLYLRFFVRSKGKQKGHYKFNKHLNIFSKIEYL